MMMLDLYGSADQIPPQCTGAQLVRFPLQGSRREIRESLGLLGNHRVEDIMRKRKRIPGEGAPWSGAVVTASYVGWMYNC